MARNFMHYLPLEYVSFLGIHVISTEGRNLIYQ